MPPHNNNTTAARGVNNTAGMINRTGEEEEHPSYSGIHDVTNPFTQTTPHPNSSMMQQPGRAA